MFVVLQFKTKDLTCLKMFYNKKSFINLLEENETNYPCHSLISFRMCNSELLEVK